MVQVASHNPRCVRVGLLPRMLQERHCRIQRSPVGPGPDDLSWDFLGGKKLGFDTFHLTQHLMISVWSPSYKQSWRCKNSRWFPNLNCHFIQQCLFTGGYLNKQSVNEDSLWPPNRSDQIGSDDHGHHHDWGYWGLNPPCQYWGIQNGPRDPRGTGLARVSGKSGPKHGQQTLDACWMSTK